MYWYHKPTSLYNWPSIACPRSMWEMWRLLSRIQRFSGCNTMNFCVERAHSSWWFVWFVGWYTQEIWVVLVYSRLVCLQLVGKRCYIYILCNIIMYYVYIIHYSTYNGTYYDTYYGGSHIPRCCTKHKFAFLWLKVHNLVVFNLPKPWEAVPVYRKDQHLVKWVIYFTFFRI